MRTGPRSENLPVPPLPACSANTRGIAAIAAAAAPVFSMWRLVGSSILVSSRNDWMEFTRRSASSLVPQGVHRIHTRRSAGGHVAGDEGDRYPDDGRRNVRG